jgi:hypothetical protein
MENPKKYMRIEIVHGQIGDIKMRVMNDQQVWSIETFMEEILLKRKLAELKLWCPGPESNRHVVANAGF